jgi:Flp pilus assembly protein TadD
MDELALAERHRTEGRLAEAEAVLRAVLARLPACHPAYHGLALVALDAGRPALAAELIQRAIALAGDVALYQRNLGELCRRLGRLDEAIGAGRRACALAPEDAEAHYNLGLALADRSDFAAAIAEYRRALELAPAHGYCWNNLGAALEKSGERAAAEEAYTKAIAIDPQHAEALNNLGTLCMERGRLDEARRSLEAAVAAAPNFIEAHFNLSDLKTYREGDAQLAHLEASVERAESMPPQARVRLWFALGKAREDVGRHDAAFAAYAEGNRMQHALTPYEETRDERLVEAIERVFTREFFAARTPPAPREGWAPIFIVGMPRSGTTLLEQILASHPAVHGAGELVDLHEVIAGEGARLGVEYPELAARLPQDGFARLGEAYVERVRKLAPVAERITDKMPANFFYLGLIRFALPQARVIHAMRDPMDSCFSCYAHLFRHGMEFTYDLGSLGRYYARYMRLMRHWHAVLPAGTILDLPYERVVADVEGEARRIVEFAGLPWDERCLAFHENRRPVHTASLAQVRRPIYKSSVARWQRFATHLAPLLELVREYR